MKNIIGFLSSKIVSGIILTTISGLTIFTSAAGVVKVASSISNYKPKIPEVKTVQSALAEDALLGKTNPTPTKKPLSAGFASNDPVATPRPTETNPQTANTNACIITLFGKQYDVTTLQTSHSGGNVFKCGTDQTALYQSQHGTDLTRMQPYLVTGGTAGSSVNSSFSGNTSIKADDDIESEDGENDFNQRSNDKNNIKQPKSERD